MRVLAQLRRDRVEDHPALPSPASEFEADSSLHPAAFSVLAVPLWSLPIFVLDIPSFKFPLSAWSFGFCAFGEH